jgi:uncharacterized FlaG/YvyC family protein
MATISIINGGPEPKLTSQATETVVKPTVKRGAAPTQNPPKPEQPPAEAPDAVSLDHLRSIIRDVQQTLNTYSVEPLTVAFRMDERAEGYVIEIRNVRGDVVRQFPPEKVLNLRSKLDELSGMVIDEKS